MAVFDDFPFTRVVKLNSAGDEIPGTARCVTDRPMTVAELLLAKGGEDVEEGQLDVKEASLTLTVSPMMMKTTSPNTTVVLMMTRMTTTCLRSTARGRRRSW